MTSHYHLRLHAESSQRFHTAVALRAVCRAALRHQCACFRTPTARHHRRHHTDFLNDGLGHRRRPHRVRRHVTRSDLSILATRSGFLLAASHCYHFRSHADFSWQPHTAFHARLLATTRRRRTQLKRERDTVVASRHQQITPPRHATSTRLLRIATSSWPCTTPSASRRLSSHSGLAMPPPRTRPPTTVRGLHRINAAP